MSKGVNDSCHLISRGGIGITKLISGSSFLPCVSLVLLSPSQLTISRINLSTPVLHPFGIL